MEALLGLGRPDKNDEDSESILGSNRKELQMKMP